MTIGVLVCLVQWLGCAVCFCGVLVVLLEIFFVFGVVFFWHGVGGCLGAGCPCGVELPVVVRCWSRVRVEEPTGD